MSSRTSGQIFSFARTFFSPFFPRFSDTSLWSMGESAGGWWDEWWNLREWKRCLKPLSDSIIFPFPLFTFSLPFGYLSQTPQSFMLHAEVCEYLKNVSRRGWKKDSSQAWGMAKRWTFFLVSSYHEEGVERVDWRAT